MTGVTVLSQSQPALCGIPALKKQVPYHSRRASQCPTPYKLRKVAGRSRDVKSQAWTLKQPFWPKSQPTGCSTRCWKWYVEKFTFDMRNDIQFCRAITEDCWMGPQRAKMVKARSIKGRKTNTILEPTRGRVALQYIRPPHTFIPVDLKKNFRF